MTVRRKGALRRIPRPVRWRGGPRFERLERRDLLASFAYSEVYAEATLTDLTNGESEVVRLRGSMTGELDEAIGNLALEDRGQQLLSLSLEGFESERFGRIEMMLRPTSLNLGSVTERRNDIANVIELPAISRFDLDFQLVVTSHDGIAPSSTTLFPSGPARIEAGVGELPFGVNDTFRTRARSLNLSTSPSEAPVMALSDFALTVRPLFATMSGQRFHDVNSNGQRDQGESGRNGVAMVAVDLRGGDQAIAAFQVSRDIDWNGDQVIDPETESGWYVFDDLPPGDYLVTELIQPGWVPTAPIPSPRATPDGSTGLLPPNAGPGQEWLADITTRRGTWRAVALAGIDWPTDGNLDGQTDETVLLGGAEGIARLGWQTASASNDGGPLDQSLLELASYRLAGNSSQGGLVLAGGDGTLDFADGGANHSPGMLESVPGNPLSAAAHFTLDFALQVGAIGGENGITLRPASPVTVRAAVDRLPLDGFVFTTDAPVALVDDQQQAMARLTSLRWVLFLDSTVDAANGYEVPLALGRAFGEAHFGTVDQPEGPYGLDFGDAPREGAFQYPTLLADNGARHAIDGRLYLGASIDAEVDGTPDLLARGDDQLYTLPNHPLDDEDGVAFRGAAVAGQNLSVDVTASRSGLLNAWVDFNADGDWSDPGEQVFTDVSLVAGLNSLTIAVPGGAVTGVMSMARFRLSSAGGLAPTGLASDGEVEDYALFLHATAPPATDFGDARSTFIPGYPTVQFEGGASHVIGGHYLGSWVDGEGDGAPNFTFDGDDLAGVADEDGVRVVRSLVLGESGLLQVDATLPGFLNAWIDFNQDGDWDDPLEHVIQSLPVEQGTNLVEVRVPSGAEGARASAGAAARFRFTADAGEGTTPGGAATTGEVEDYLVPIEHPVVNLVAGPWNLAIAPTTTTRSLADRSSAGPGLVGLSSSPWEQDSLDPRFSQLANQSFFYRIGEEGGESPLGNLRLVSAQTDYESSTLRLEYGDAAAGDPIRVEIFHTLSSSLSLESVSIDELIIITNLTLQPIDLTWFSYTDANINGGFGDHDVGRVDGDDSFVQSSQFGETMELLITSPPFPDAYQIGLGDGLLQGLSDGNPTQLDNSPTLGQNSAQGDVTQAFQWNIPLGFTSEDNSVLLSLTKNFNVIPVVTPDGALLTSATGGAATGGVIAGRGTASDGGTGAAEAAGFGSGAGALGPVACRGLCILDPTVAIGFDFVSESSNGFSSVRLPFGFGDDAYVVQTPNGLGGWSNHGVAAGETYSFLGEFPQGLGHFRILGIETSANVDPRDPLAFPALVRFVGDLSEWKVRMTGIPERVYVDPLLRFGEEINVSNFRVIENGDVVTYLPETPSEVRGLVFGQTAFASRAEALESLGANGFAGLTQTIEQLADFGDAPAPYPTLAIDQGAVHGLGSGLTLGSTVDDDPDGQPSSDARGDDGLGIDDEDGVEFLNAWVPQGTAQLRVTSSGAGLVSAWVDWNADGDWSDPNEQVLVNQAVVVGQNLLSFAIPAAAAQGTTFARFRLSSAGSLAPTGPAPDGEVEDYSVLVGTRPQVSGRKYADINGNSRRDAGEPYLNGWTIQLLDDSNQVLRTTTTADIDLDGNSTIDPQTERGVYRFEDLGPGTYRLRELVPGDWLQTAPDYSATMDGTQQFPAAITSGRGVGAFGWDEVSSTLAFSIDFASVAGSTVSLKLYDGAPGTAGVELRDLGAAAGVTAGFSGPVRGTVALNAAEAARLAAGSLYVSLHTTAFPAGEIRGQVLPGTVHRFVVGDSHSYEGLDFGNSAAQSQTNAYPASQGQLVIELPGGAQETIRMVGSSSMRLYVADDGTTGDSDLNGRDDASQELTALALRGFASMGRVDVRVRATDRSFGRIEEGGNITPGRLDLPPYSATGSATSFLDLFLEVTITQGSNVKVLHTATAARVTGMVTSDPMALGESLVGAANLELLDETNQPTGFRLVNQSYTPSPLRPWHNIVRRLDVDNSGAVVPLDALLVINELNSPLYSTNGVLPAPVDPALPPPPYVDVSGNGGIEPLDALLVINFLNGVAEEEGGESNAGEGERGESEGGSLTRIVAVAVADGWRNPGAIPDVGERRHSLGDGRAWWPRALATDELLVARESAPTESWWQGLGWQGRAGSGSGSQRDGHRDGEGSSWWEEVDRLLGDFDTGNDPWAGDLESLVGLADD